MSSDPSPTPVTLSLPCAFCDSPDGSKWHRPVCVEIIEREAAAPAATETLRAALERLGERHHALSDHNPATVFQMRPAFEGLAECDDYTCVEARAALSEPTP